MSFQEGNKNGKQFSSEYQPSKNGRPKKLPAIDELLSDALGEEKEGFTAAQRILKALILKAEKGDVRAAELLLDRGYGKAKQFISAEVNENKKPSWFDNLPVITTTNGVQSES